MIDSSFEHSWHAEILRARPLILPSRQFVYPAQVEEVERGALEVLVHPARVATPVTEHGAQPDAQPGVQAPFLATCALGFASPSAPTGVWACPDPAWMCAVAGGYAYLIDTAKPSQWQQIEYRPVTAVRALPEQQLLLFAGFTSLLAWNRTGIAWQTGRLSWDGVSLQAITGDTLFGLGWDMQTDRELEFEVDLKTGAHRGGGYLRA